MRYLRFLSLISYVALSLGAADQTGPSKPLGSVVTNFIDYEKPGASPANLHKGAPGHYHGGHSPGWGNHPHGPGNCVQIQSTFPKGENGPGSVSAKRAKAVKVGWMMFEVMES